VVCPMLVDCCDRKLLIYIGVSFQFHFVVP
jgi:hypothetical protein